MEGSLELESEMRELIEALIDEMFDEESIIEVLQWVRNLKPAVKSVEDTVFGYLIGNAHSYFSHRYYLEHDKKPIISDHIKFRDILLESTTKIMSKIREATKSINHTSPGD